MAPDDGFQGVSNCYVFKSRLQEYAQKVKLRTPTYNTIKEGPSHEPSFKSTVIVDDVRYDSLPGFSSRKAAEQSAAEVALIAIANSGAMDESIYQPVHDTGLCKNLLQEYAQKMNYAIPTYECQKDEKLGMFGYFFCTVDIGGIKYIGGAARSKKEAELKAARTALLAIQSDPSVSSTKHNANSLYTVVPSKRKVSDISSQETSAALKPKAVSFKKKSQKKRRNRERDNNAEDRSMKGNMDTNIECQAGPELNKPDAVIAQVTDSGHPPMEAIQDKRSELDEGELSAEEGPVVSCSSGEFLDGHLVTLDSQHIPAPSNLHPSATTDLRHPMAPLNSPVHRHPPESHHPQHRSTTYKHRTVVNPGDQIGKMVPIREIGKNPRLRIRFGGKDVTVGGNPIIGKGTDDVALTAHEQRLGASEQREASETVAAACE